MHINLFNQYITDPEDYAIEILQSFELDGWHPIVFEQVGDGLKMDCSVKIPRKKGFLVLAQVYDVNWGPHSKSIQKQIIPHYVGSGIISDRLYRFGKEALGLSREDESHPAGKIFRERKADINYLFVKFITFDDMVLPDTADVDKIRDSLRNMIMNDPPTWLKNGSID